MDVSCSGRYRTYAGKRQNCVSKQMSVFTGKLKELFSGYEVLKSYNRIENTILRFQGENEKEIHTRFKAARLFALNEGLSDTMSVLSTIAVIFVSAYLVLIGHITMGTLLALVIRNI
ncbi:ABC transporter transmembrane domain-containing protein [Sporofaciens musculi]|nr:ABC transporter transmembrane domain-containing protein [Sporofaciens musculi]